MIFRLWLPSTGVRKILTWWRHQMETFSALLALCEVNSPVTGEFPAQRPVTQTFDIFFDLRLNKRLNKQSWAGYLRRQFSHYDVTVMRMYVLNTPIRANHDKLMAKLILQMLRVHKKSCPPFFNNAICSTNGIRNNIIYSWCFWRQHQHHIIKQYSMRVKLLTICYNLWNKKVCINIA